MISPNGEWVAFCTGDMGGQGGSSVFHSKTRFTRFRFHSAIGQKRVLSAMWVDPILKDTFIVYASSAIF